MEENKFFVIFLATIIITRIFLYYKPTASPTIFRFRLHHYMYGIFLIFISILLKNIYLYGVGAGLFIDEVPYLLLKGKTHADNYSKKSLVLLIVFVVVIFFLKKLLLTIPHNSLD